VVLKSVLNIVIVYAVINPSSGSVIGNVPDMAGDDVDHAIDAAYKAFQSWKLTTAKVQCGIVKLHLSTTALSAVFHMI